MKILLISTAILPVPPVHYGGLEAVVYDLAEMLHKKGHDVTVACPTESKLSKGVKHLKTVSTRMEGPYENLAMMRIKEELKNFDIIHDHSHQKLSYYVIREGGEENFKYCSTLHCPTSVLYPVLEPNLICVSKSHAAYIHKDYGYQTKYVYNGIDLGRLTFSEEKTDRYVFIGRPQKFKGVLEAIQFCKDLNVPLDVIAGALETEPDLYWVKVAQVCTGWVGRSYNKTHPELGGRGMWKYYGAVSHEVKAKLLARAKALIFPLNWDVEPFGLTIPEAYASGTPVVVYNKASMPELVKHGKTGFLANNPAEFKEYMKQVDDIKPKYLRSVAAGKFSRGVMANNYLKLYKKIVEEDLKW